MSKKKKVSSGKAGKKGSDKKKSGSGKDSSKKKAKPLGKKAKGKKGDSKLSKAQKLKKSDTKKLKKSEKKAHSKKSALKPVTKSAHSKSQAKKPAPKNTPKNLKVKKVDPKDVKKPVAKKAEPAKKIDVKKAAIPTKGARDVKKNGFAKAEKPKPQPAKAEIKNSANNKAVATPAAAAKKAPVSNPLSKKAEETAPRKSGERRNDVLAITNTIPVKAKNEISLSKIASISHSITNPVKKTDSYAVKAEKEPNGKFEMEFVVHSSAEMLYEFLSTPSGLSEWFCDDLNIRNGIYTFIWDDQLQQARLLKTVDQQLVRFQWVDKTDGSYFEFRIQRDDLTNDIALIITDFADTASERESAKLLWHSQIEKLMHVIGSIF